MLLYSTLARARLNGRISEARALRLVPQLRTERLHSSALYADARTNDGRLTIENVVAAAGRGRRRPQLRQRHRDPPRRRRRARRRPRRRACARRRSSTRPGRGSITSGASRIPRRQPSIRLSKGVHVVVDGGEDWGAAVTIPQSKVRVSFAIPWEGMLLLGTTDTLHEGEPDDGRRSPTRTCARSSTRRRAQSTASAPVRASFLGLRVLPGGPGATANARRETVYTRGPTGMLSVAGGKLTTYRRIALDALAQLGVRNLDRTPRPLPGAIGLANVDWPVELDARDAQPPAPPLRLARRGRRPAGARRRVAPRAARARTPRSARAGCVGARRTSSRCATRTSSVGARPAGWPVR